MNLRYLFFSVSIFALWSLSTAAVFAQAASSMARYDQPEGSSEAAASSTGKPAPEAPVLESPILVADVNFQDVSAVFENGAWHVGFSVKSSFGSQDAVSLGIVVRDIPGRLLDHTLVSAPIFLAEGAAAAQTAVYRPSPYLSADGVVYLVAYNARGMLLAIKQIGEVKRAENIPFTCTESAAIVTCASEKSASLTLRIQQGGPFGKLMSETLVAGSPQPIDLKVLTKDLPTGLYDISLLSSEGESGMVYATEYTKVGDVARIISVTPQLTTKEGAERLQVRVFAELFSASGAAHTLTISTGTCAPQTLPIDRQTADFVFDASCTGSDVRVDLQTGDQTVDMLTVALASPASSSDATKVWHDRLLYGIFGLFVISLAFIAGKRFMSRRKVLMGVFFILTLFGSMDALPAEAATYVIGGQARYVGCLTGGWPGCAEPDPSDRGYTTTGTVTVPNSVGPNEVYTISITQSLTSSDLTQCRDTAAAAWATCTPTQVSTESFVNLPAPRMATVYGEFLWDYNTLPPGYGNSLSGYLGSNPSTTSIGYLNAGNPSGTFSRTSPSSGVADVLAFVQIVDAGFSVHCTDNCITYPYSYNSISVPMATTTCDLGCGGSVQWRANATNAIDDFTCPPGQKLITNRGSWTGPLACQGTFTHDPFGGTMSCVADAACTPPPPSCNWVGSGYIDGRQPPGANALHNSSRCTTPNPSDGTPLPSACNIGYDGGLTVCCDTGADCFRFTCTCGAPSVCPAPQVQGQEILCMRGIWTADQDGPTAFCTTPADCTAKRNQLMAGFCTGPYDGSDPFKFPCFCSVEAPLICGTAGVLPTLILTGAPLAYVPDTFFGQTLGLIKEALVPNAKAAGPDVNINLGDSMQLTWTSTNAATCTLTVPSQAPRAVPTSGATTVAGLPVGTHTLTMTCFDASGIQSAVDTVTVIVAAPVPDMKICPASAILGSGFTTQLRTYYIANGTVDCANTAGATDVTALTSWSSTNAGVATVDNAGSKGLVTGVTAGSTTVSVASYLGATAPGVTITITCVPTNSCASAGPSATAANRCPGDTFTINDGCGGLITCPGTRVCDFNWKEVGQ